MKHGINVAFHFVSVSTSHFERFTRIREGSRRERVLPICQLQTATLGPRFISFLRDNSLDPARLRGK